VREALRGIERALADTPGEPGLAAEAAL
jgi:hypothetical protein